MSNKISFKTDDGLESNFFTRDRQYAVTESLQNKYTFDLNLGTYRGSKFQNPPFHLLLMADMSSLKFVYMHNFTE